MTNSHKYRRRHPAFSLSLIAVAIGMQGCAINSEFYDAADTGCKLIDIAKQGLTPNFPFSPCEIGLLQIMAVDGALGAVRQMQENSNQIPTSGLLNK